MNKIFSLTKKIVTNPAILYVISRYGTYAIQFINSLFIAKFLGPFYFGIWGFFNLVKNYVEQLNLGINHSINIFLSIKKNEQESTNKIIGNGIVMILTLSFFILFFFILYPYLGISIGNKYNFREYIIPISIIVFFTHINNFFLNILRVFGKILTIALVQSLYPLLMLFVIPFFRGKELLWSMVVVNSICLVLSFIILVTKNPVKISFKINLPTIKNIQKKGFYLFIYNTFFGFILLSTRSLISNNYSVQEFGFFSFSYSLSNIILLLLNSISFLIFPKMINRLVSFDNNKKQEFLDKMRSVYISLSHLLVYIVIMLFPTFIMLFPKYEESVGVFGFIALTIVLYNNSFGYQDLLMANNKDKLLAMAAFSAFCLNLILSVFFVFVLKLEYKYIILSTLVTYFFYVWVLAILGRKEIRKDNNKIWESFKDAYPINILIPFLINLLLILMDLYNFSFIPVLVFLFLNVKELIKIKDVIVNVIKKPDIINI